MFLALPFMYCQTVGISVGIAKTMSPNWRSTRHSLKKGPKSAFVKSRL